jgi:hypothetical protein
LIEEGRKKVQQKQNPYSKVSAVTPQRVSAATPQRVQNVHPPHSNSMKSELKMSPSVKLISEDDPLLIGSNSKSGSKGGSSGKALK